MVFVVADPVGGMGREEATRTTDALDQTGVREMAEQVAEQDTLFSEKKKRMTTPELLEILRGHYIAETTDMHARDGGSFAHEVSVNGTWGAGSRRADALYAGFTSASGRILIGHELKVSRSDWRHELDQLDKADTWADACHAWYVVAPSTEVVPPEELPEGWGLMLPPRSSRGKRMRIEVKAKVRENFSPPWWAVRSFMARLDTLAHQKRLDEVQRIVRAREEERRKAMEKRLGDHALSTDQRQRLEVMQSLESTLGLEITAWRDNITEGRVSAETLAAAANLVASSKNYQVRNFDRVVKDMADAHTVLVNEVLPAMEELGRISEGGKK